MKQHAAGVGQERMLFGGSVHENVVITLDGAVAHEFVKEWKTEAAIGHVQRTSSV